MWQGEDRSGDGLAIKPGNQFALVEDHFAQCFRDDVNSKTPGEEGLRDVKIITSIYKAAKPRTAVKLA